MRSQRDKECNGDQAVTVTCGCGVNDGADIDRRAEEHETEYPYGRFAIRVRRGRVLAALIARRQVQRRRSFSRLEPVQRIARPGRAVAAAHG